MLRSGLLLILSYSLTAAAVSAQSNGNPVVQGAMEWGFQGGGGTAVAGGEQDRSYGMLAGRWGLVLTPQLPAGPLRGNLEYGMEAIPVFIMSQSNTVYAAGFAPVQFRYNFTAGRRVVPYFEIGSSVLFSTSDIPESTSSINFASHGGFGIHLFSAGARSIAFGARYIHISNAGIANRNPGINTIYFYTGLSWWR